MTPINLILGSLIIFSAVVVILLARPLLKGEVKMNRLYGVRMAKSFESDEAWYAMNRFGAQRMIFWARIMIGVGLVAFFVPMTSPAVVVAFSLAPLLFCIPCLEAYRYGKTLATM